MKPGRIIDYNKKLPIVELYYCVQSEASRAGYPTVAIRTTGCTHRCWFGEGGWCDSWYTSIHPEKGGFTFNDIVKMYDDRPDIKEMMLTGGSPTMHADLVNELTHFAHERGIIITIETEGSHFIETDYPIDLISLSPKFSNSVPKLGVLTPKGAVVDQKMIDQHNKLRLNKEAIKQTLAYHKDYHYKPVCNPVEMPEVWKEIEEFRIEMGIPKNKTWLMPPGDNRQELIRVYPMVIDFCTDNGYNFTGREHIISYDTKRGV
jgi:7-carboxy-7-deazaguanine synthase